MSCFRNTKIRLPGLLAMMALLVSGFCVAAMEDDIRERLQPPGEVCMMGDSCASAMATTASASDGPRDAESIYKTACFACHDTGVAEAPVLGNAEQWAPRIEKGIDALYESGINGVEGTTMVAKGGCAACTDDEIRSVVDYMVSAAE